jgi:hypothetical protein
VGGAGQLVAFATGTNPLFLELFFGGGQNTKKREVFAAARLDAGPFFFYLFFIFWLLFKMHSHTNC